MLDTTPQSKSSEVAADSPQDSKAVGKTAENKTDDVSFGLYEQVNNHPFFANYYGMENLWADPTGGYKGEIQLIEGYFKELTGLNELDNTIEAVKSRMKKIEHECNVSKDDSANARITKTAAYIKYLKEVRDINKQRSRWSNG